MNDKYILDGKNVVPCPDLLKWAAWIDKADRQVAKDHIDEIMISTVFIGIDQNWGNHRSMPILFETMTHDKGADVWADTRRYCTWEEAESGHKEVVELVKARLANANHKSVSALDSIMEKSRLGKSSSDTP